MTYNPHFSIIVPVHRTPLPFLRDCLNSLRLQAVTSDRFEVVLWDDGSGDDYVAALLGIVRDVSLDGTVKMIVAGTTTNRGIGAARNAAAALSKGKWLVFVDSDDCVHEQLLTSILPFTAQDEVDLIYTDHVLMDSGLSEPIQSRHKASYQSLHQRYRGTLWDPLLHATYIFHCQVVRSSVFRELGGFIESLDGGGEETDLHIRLLSASSTLNIAHVPEVLYFYRDNPTSVVHDQIYYKKLITNLSTILARHASRVAGDVVSAQRIGRAVNTNAAHYVLRDSRGQPLIPPWFDMPNMVVKEAPGDDE